VSDVKKKHKTTHAEDPDFKTLFFEAAILLREREFSTRHLKTYVRTECLTCGASVVGWMPPKHKKGCALQDLLLRANIAKEDDILAEIEATTSP
jgi:hypothetical protein